MTVYQTEAIILKREDIGEADRLYTVYSKDFGKLKIIANGVRKITAKLTGHLEPFNLAWIELISKKNGQFGLTTALSRGALVVNPTSAQIALAVKKADFIDRMLVQPQKDEILWDFIVKSLSKAEALDNFKKTFLDLLGYGDNFEVARHYLSDFDVL